MNNYNPLSNNRPVYPWDLSGSGQQQSNAIWQPKLDLMKALKGLRDATNPAPVVPAATLANPMLDRIKQAGEEAYNVWRGGGDESNGKLYDQILAAQKTNSTGYEQEDMDAFNKALTGTSDADYARASAIANNLRSDRIAKAGFTGEASVLNPLKGLYGGLGVQ